MEFDRDRYVASLKIDEDDLDGALIEQPGLFFHVSEQVTLTKSRRDGIKLQLKELVAEVDKEIRETAERQGEKTREDAIKHLITLDPDVKRLERMLLDANLQADKADVLKESYQQRSYALKDLVATELGRLYSMGVERGAVSARNRKAEQIAERIGELPYSDRRRR